jgi:hypothetical protein
MKTKRYALALAVLLSAHTASANDQPPSDESIQALRSLTHEQESFDLVRPQLDAMISASMSKMSRGVAMTPQRQAILDRMHQKYLAAFDEYFNDTELQSITQRVYQATYTQDEIDGLIAFFKTPSGQALINKKPLMVQELFKEMQALTQPMMQRMNQIGADAEREMKALSPPAAAPSAPK